MNATLKTTAVVAAILVLALAAVPAHAAGPRSETVRHHGPATLAGGWSFGAWLLDWLGLSPAAVAGPGLERVTAAGGGAMDPDGTPTAAGGGTMDPDGTPTTTGGVGMDPDGTPTASGGVGTDPNG